MRFCAGLCGSALPAWSGEDTRSKHVGERVSRVPGLCLQSAGQEALAKDKLGEGTALPLLLLPPQCLCTSLGRPLNESSAKTSGAPALC